MLYRKLERSGEEEARKTGLEGDVEHQLVAGQLEELGRGRAKDGDAWSARFTVLTELVRHHVREEENETFAQARREFDNETLDKLGEQFRREKEKLL